MDNAKVGDRVVSEDGYNGVVFKVEADEYGLMLAYFRSPDGRDRCRRADLLMVCVEKEDMAPKPEPERYMVTCNENVYEYGISFDEAIEVMKDTAANGNESSVYKIVASIKQEVEYYE